MVAIRTLVLAFALLCAGAASAQEPANTVQDLTVKGRRTPVEQQAYDYVQALTKPSRQDPLSRWQLPICPMVAGLPRDKGEYVLARLSQVARQAGAPFSRKAKCRANLVIVVTDQPQALLKGWRERNRQLFGAAMPPTIRRFLDEERPVRVWQNDLQLDADGVQPADSPTDLRVMRQVKDTRLTWNAIVVFSSVVVVVDANRMNGATFAQLADYVAMAGLAKLDLDADTGGAPSILRLFDEPALAPRLSAWDEAFLKALYSTSQSNRMQRSTIARQIATAPPP